MQDYTGAIVGSIFGGIFLGMIIVCVGLFLFDKLYLKRVFVDAASSTSSTSNMSSSFDNVAYTGDRAQIASNEGGCSKQVQCYLAERY